MMYELCFVNAGAMSHVVGLNCLHVLTVFMNINEYLLYREPACGTMTTTDLCQSYPSEMRELG